MRHADCTHHASRCPTARPLCLGRRPRCAARAAADGASAQRARVAETLARIRRENELLRQAAQALMADDVAQQQEQQQQQQEKEKEKEKEEEAQQQGRTQQPLLGSHAAARAAPAAAPAGAAVTAPAAPQPAPLGLGPSVWGYPVLEPLEPLQPRAPGTGSNGRPRGPRCATPLSIVFAAAEVAPWSKTGGLGDVMGSLPRALAARGHRVMVVAPRHTNGGADEARYRDARPAPCGPIRIQLGSGAQEVAFHTLTSDGVDWVFVDHPAFGRPGTPYGDARGPFDDNLFRFALLSLAALEAPIHLKHLEGGPYPDDITLVGNDWHTALAPVLMRHRYQPGGSYRGATSALVIHNMAHQGVFPPSAFNGLSLPGGLYGLMEWRPPPAAPGAGGGQARLNVLKAGLLSSDALVTVSERYALEVTSSPQPLGIEKLLEERRALLRGITNGVDTREWDPASDPHIAANYTAADLSGKAACKRALQRELRFDPDPSAPLLGFVGRLDHQKGPDIILDALPALAALGCQVVMLGSGAADYEEAAREATRECGSFFRAVVGFSAPLAHRLIAGCDILLMPSRFEPCGLNQLHAMRYGTVPVAAATGGLVDTIDDVNPFDEGEGTGWTFAPATPATMCDAVAAAVRRFRGPRASWAALARRGMAVDSSWDGAAGRYESVLLSLRRERRPAQA